MLKSLALLCLLPLSLAAQFASGTDQYITEAGVRIQRDSLTYVSATDPGCTYVGRVWQNTATTTTVNNICQNVSGVLTWVISGTGSLPASATVIATNSGGVGIAAPLPTGDIWFGTGNLPVASTLATAGIQPSSKGCTIVGSTTLANCVTQLTAGGGTITCPAGTTASIASTLILDNLSGITIQGTNDAAGGLPACVILFTGATGPAISIKNSFGMRITGVAIEWNNASFTSGDIINTDNGALSTNTSELELDHLYFAAISGGVAVSNVLNINNTINTNIHDNNFCGPAAVAILGANTSSDFTAAITIGPQNNFGCGAGTFSGSFIRNIESANVHNNTFEMSIGAGSPAVMDQTVAVISQGVSFGPGNWIGDTPAGYNNYFFNFTSGDVEGWSVYNNTIASRTTASGGIFNLGVPTFGFSVTGNTICGPIIMTSAANNTGIGVHYNLFCGGITTGLNVASGNLNGIEWSGNSGSPSTYVSGTPVSGSVVNGSQAVTYYGAYGTTRTLPIAFGDANNTIAISTGAVTYFKATYPCTITGWDITVDAGTITYDVWKIAAGTAIPTIANTITASALPALSTGTALHSTTLTGWTTAVAAGDWLGYQVNTVSGAHNSTFQLECRQTGNQ